MTKHWNSLSGQVVETPSLEIFKTWLDMVLSNLLLMALPWAGRLDYMISRGPFLDLPTSTILWLFIRLYQISLQKLSLKSHEKDTCFEAINSSLSYCYQVPISEVILLWEKKLINVRSKNTLVSPVDAVVKNFFCSLKWDFSAIFSVVARVSWNKSKGFEKKVKSIETDAMKYISKLQVF